MRRVLDELKYHSEYGFILLMGISKTSDFARFFELKGFCTFPDLTLNDTQT